MATFYAETTVEFGKLLLKIDGINVIIDSGTTDFYLPDNENFILQWFVKGVPGSSYSIKIKSPENASINLTKIIKPTGKDYGGFSFGT